ncbi:MULTISPECIES: LLM class flavin-dependent oxidoreductase [Rhodomicrobium]|uniref:LLM class flavin-dependent oxidoreductase n=1 Tax=Rhodomicrobium TaxID=1068 RepID=UPI000B4BF66F|nr:MULTISPECIES: LLM class flavin-dependent oxidoreductase [Rhodomicrobium]
MSKEIRLNAFTMNTVGHMSPGLWTHPRDRSSHYTDLKHWADLAKTLERGRFDAVFIADVIGIYDVYNGDPTSPIRHATQIPVGDPLLIVPAMALVTEHLSFGVTSSVSYEHPYPFARRFSTLDHLIKGRVAWNVVTSYLDSGARATGQQALAGHDDRYDLAEDYLEVCYKLWEGSWEDGAVRRDKASGVFTDPSKVHNIRHKGPHFQVDGIHLSEPSPQRTPVIFQAGASTRGRQFAARHAEAIFVGAPSKHVLKNYVDALRAGAVEQGRRADDLVIYNMHTVIVAETDAEAQEKHAEYRKHISHEGALTLMSGWSGIDFGKYQLDEPLRYVKTNAGQSFVEAFSSSDPAREWTLREMAEWVAIGGRGPTSIGSPKTVADELEAWVNETGVDGFNLASVVMPETFEQVADLLVPELQRRGLFKKDYAEGTLRQKLFGRGDRIAAGHPAHAAREAVRAAGR